MKVLGYIITTIGVLIFNVMFSAFALCKMWVWFITPEFGVAAIGMPTAIGISMIVTYLTYQETPETKNGDEYWEVLVKGFFKGLFRPAFALLFGWIVTLFM